MILLGLESDLENEVFRGKKCTIIKIYDEIQQNYSTERHAHRDDGCTSRRVDHVLRVQQRDSDSHESG